MSNPSVGILIIEINEQTTDQQPAMFYLRELAEANGTQSKEIIPLLEYTTASGSTLYDCHALRGIFEGEQPATVRMAMLRFNAPYNTDIVIHMRSTEEDASDAPLVDEFFMSWVKTFEATDSKLKALLNI